MGNNQSTQEPLKKEIERGKRTYVYSKIVSIEKSEDNSQTKFIYNLEDSIRYQDKWSKRIIVFCPNPSDKVEGKESDYLFIEKEWVGRWKEGKNINYEDAIIQENLIIFDEKKAKEMIEEDSFIKRAEARAKAWDEFNSGLDVLCQTIDEYPGGWGSHSRW